MGGMYTDVQKAALRGVVSSWNALTEVYSCMGGRRGVILSLRDAQDAAVDDIVLDSLPSVRVAEKRFESAFRAALQSGVGFDELHKRYVGQANWDRGALLKLAG